MYLLTKNSHISCELNVQLQQPHKVLELSRTCARMYSIILFTNRTLDFKLALSGSIADLVVGHYQGQTVRWPCHCKRQQPFLITTSAQCPGVEMEAVHLCYKIARDCKQWCLHVLSSALKLSMKMGAVLNWGEHVKAYGINKIRCKTTKQYVYILYKMKLKHNTKLGNSNSRTLILQHQWNYSQPSTFDWQTYFTKGTVQAASDFTARQSQEKDMGSSQTLQSRKSKSISVDRLSSDHCPFLICLPSCS